MTSLFLLLGFLFVITSSSSSSSTTTTTALAMSTSAASAAASRGASKYRGALIFLHGLGDTPAGWSDLERSLPQYSSRLSQIKYVFPPAPTIPITINGGTTMPGWFDLFDWPIDVGSKDDPTGLYKGIEQIQSEVTRLIEEDNIPPSQIVVGGFSQGGAVALLSCYHPKNKIQFAGCIGLSAWLTLPDEVTNNNDNKDIVTKIPLFWGHGTYDDKVLFPQQDFGIRKLKDELGVTDIIGEDYPVGHSAHPKEMQQMASFLEKCIFGSEDDSKEL
jgi:predicted esterase